MYGAIGASQCSDREADLVGGVVRRSLSSYIGSLAPSAAVRILPAPASLDGPCCVCFRASGGAGLCRWFLFHAQPLPDYRMPQAWVDEQGDCEGCDNAGGLTSFLHSLNPRRWLDGIGSVRMSLRCAGL